MATEIIAATKQGVQVAAVVGGGNMFRGAALAERGIDRARADYMGMLGTVINCLALQDVLEKKGVRRGSRRDHDGPGRRALHPAAGDPAPGKGRVVIFGAGLGAPYFSTDTAAAQRALEIGADAVLRAPRWTGSTMPTRIPPRTPCVRPAGLLRGTERGLGHGRHGGHLVQGQRAADRGVRADGRGNVVRAVRGEKIGTLICRTSAAGLEDAAIPGPVAAAKLLSTTSNTGAEL